MQVSFTLKSFEDLSFWIKTNPRKALKIIKLIKEVERSPFSGIGKPEPLKYKYRDCWSRRIDREHRLVYKVLKDTIYIIACRYHY